ncbi:MULTISPECIES: ead/Ea22-like family protein [Salmonella]|uniref:Ead/Ea22-like family protein n=5 Tax=Salmonella enterica TaxID=28901 RepID=A0A639LQU6_SALET|nr:ead/Ea22-like family protein [Salmonella enterica]EDH4417312.1 ead/Ea22-like family protein [Salmonella enterica subsp. enterica serovar Schwarzengrund]EDH4834828.1 ead/Ea22-like family protein [Salmonella enterica subsp. enterica serovar Schwarzengrund]EDH4889381.1 ead/Ea22-like family protein [Salmonella enterica subsp. enterica serovar Schwarzengrund]EDH5116458.1 ead/Ea22-like family protein [Salmonella enterica subsp. enterica serovar Schwarzengrund]EDH7976868.1 ead/Ea22-like family pro
MSNIDKQAVTAKTKELASLMVERFSMNPVSCKLLNEAWGKEFPDEVAIAERMLALLDELEHYKSREERVTKLVMDNSTSWDALYKKLESSEKRIAELVNDEVRQRLANAEHQLHMAELAKCNLRASRKAQFRKRKAAERRIAELEAREIKPAKGEVLVVVSGFTGCGKSAIAGEIEIAMKAIGVPVQWTNGDAEKHMTGADWLTAIEMYKPTVRIVEVNVPRAAGIKVEGE